MVATLLFWLAAAALAYTWVGYPVLLDLVARRRRSRSPRAVRLPDVSVVVAAYNEAGCIRRKLDSALRQRYPRTRLEVIVVSDGSTDGTDSIVARYPDTRVRLIRQEPRLGKSAALNRGVAAARGEVLVFTDANAAFAPDAVARLVGPLADPRVGLVSGVGLYAPDVAGDARAVASGYVRYESRVRAGESALGVLAGADGAIYALRRHLYRDLEPAEINDLLHPIQAALAGYEARFAPGACTVEPPSKDAGQEFRRHVRMVAQGAYLVSRWLPRLVAERRWTAVWTAVSHQVLRWATGLFLLVAFAANAALARRGVLYAGMLAAQAAFYAVAIAGLLGERLGRRLGPIALVYYFCVVSAAGLAGIVSFVRGGVQATWAPTGQVPAAERAA